MVINYSKYYLILLKESFISRAIKGKLRLWITLLSITFVCSSIINNAEALADIALTREALSWMLLGSFTGLISIFVNAFAWKRLLNWLGYRSNKIELLRLYITTNLLKYIPGGIWHFAERFRVLRNTLSSGQAIASVLLEPLLMASAALLWVPFGGWQSGLGLLSFLPAILFISFFREPLLLRLERLKANQLENIEPGLSLKESIDESSKERTGYPWQSLLLEMLFIAFRFFAFWCCLSAFSIEQALPIVKWLAAFSFAWTIGLLVPGAPGGLGVFEATVLLRLGLSENDAPLLATLLCYRLVVTISDLLAALCFSWNKKKMHNL